MELMLPPAGELVMHRPRPSALGPGRGVAQPGARDPRKAAPTTNPSNTRRVILRVHIDIHMVVDSFQLHIDVW